MPKCAICEKEELEGKEKKIYTGKVLDEEQRQIASTTHTTTTYGEFQTHNFFICKKCDTLWNKIVLPVGGGLTIVLSIVLLILSLKTNSDLTALFLVVVSIGGFITLMVTSIDERLKKKARQAHGGEGKIGAFNESKYEKLLQDNQPQE